MSRFADAIRAGFRNPGVIAISLSTGVIAAQLATLIRPGHRELEPFSYPVDAEWISPGGEPQAGGSFRTDFQLPPSKVRNAWVAISADAGFELLVNGNPAGRWALYRATRPFGSGLSEHGQRLRLTPPALGLSFPREHQWGDHANWRIPIFFDIAPHLRSGANNAVAVTVEARHGRPSFILAGEIEMENGELLPLRSHPGWKAEPVPDSLSQRQWMSPGVSAAHWREAESAPPVGDSFYRFPPRGVYEEPFRGAWLPMGQSHQSRFVAHWENGGDPARHWIRIISSENYVLKVNGEVIRPRTGAKGHFAHGGWQVRPASRRALTVFPELLDPDETSGIYSGEGFLNPRHGNPGDLARHRPEEGFDLAQDSAGSVEYGTMLERSRTEGKSRLNPADPLFEQVQPQLPTAVTRPASPPDFSGFDVTPFLRKGGNEIEITVNHAPHRAGYFGRGSERLAVDAASVGEDGKPAWKLDARTHWARDGVPVAQGRTPLTEQLQRRFYRTETPPGAPAGFIGMLAFLAAFVTLAAGFGGGARRRERLKMWQGPVATVATVLACLWLVEVSLRERSGQIWLAASDAWPWLKCLIALAAGGLVASFRFSATERVKPMPQSRPVVWGVLLLVLAAGFLLRAHRLDFQPLDDDEYASVQATLSIAEKGVPELHDGIYYTRGPAYHYPAGILVKLFGPSLWTLRLPSIFAAVLTMLLTYQLCSRCLKNRWMGLVAAFLIAVHPFCIFTSHIARFYQQQQFFTLLVVFLFIHGFVMPAALWKRIATVIAFGLATLSQEISLLLLVPLGLCYAMLARKQPWEKEVKFAYVSFLVVGLVGVNLVIFKVLCLTRVEGLSPTVEATISPHFWEPMNAFALWIGYSRLHIFLAAFSVIGIAVALRRRIQGMVVIVFFLVFGVLTTVIMVTGLGFRYQYAYVPLFVITAVYGIQVVSRFLAAGRGRVPRSVVATVIVGSAVASYSPWKIPSSYGMKILPDSSGALSYVKAHFREGDRVAITEPHPHAALLEIGRSDYDIAQPILYDFVYRADDGRLVDRNGGAESLGRMNTLQRVVAQHDRIWFVINREKLKNRSHNMRWEYPGARIDFFIKKNCAHVHRAYSWDVYLWDRTAGRYHAFRMEPEGFSE